jgi:hypothetical protein
MCVLEYRRGLDRWLESLGTTSNYSTIVHLHTLKITEPAKPISSLLCEQPFPSNGF